MLSAQSDKFSTIYLSNVKMMDQFLQRLFFFVGELSYWLSQMQHRIGLVDHIL